MLSIFCKENCDTIHNGRPYGSNNFQLTIMKMFGSMGCVLLAALVLYVTPASSEGDYFPGLRRPPPMSNWAPSQNDERAYLLAQLNSIIEEQARRRFQKQRQFSNFQRGLNLQGSDTSDPSFTFQFPDNLENDNNNNNNMPFAINPSDPRYYESNTKISDGGLNSYEDDYQEQDIKSSIGGDITSKIIHDDTPYNKLKPPMDVNPKVPSSIFIRDDLNALVEKLQKDGQANAIINNNNNNGDLLQRSEVIKKPMGLEGTTGMYVVALIAGVSAAVTVGLIALGIGWYTLHKKAKAAADIDYPAYGVTGPNRDISPSGDRRLAQSAQMYHYQHQKQQIIAMENRPTGETHTGLSDVESDDDNEEGDYTVYECPGLAPTGEMEVKNPLFLDDTPVTPSTNVVDGQNPNIQSPQKQQPQKKQSKTSSTSTSPAPPPPAASGAKPKNSK